MSDISEMLDAANNEIQAAKHEIAAGPITDRLIDALELLHAALAHHVMAAHPSDPAGGNE